MKLKAEEFRIFRLQILERYRAFCADNNVSADIPETHLYGMVQTTPYTTLPAVIAQDEAVAQYLKRLGAHSVPNLKSFYEKNLQIESGKVQEVSFNSFYAGLFLTFIGCRDEAAFRTRYLGAAQMAHPATPTHAHTTQSTADTGLNKPQTLTFKGYYFSYRYFKVHEFVLEIDFSTKPYRVVERGINQTDGKEREFTGTARQERSVLYVNLERSSTERLTGDVKYAEMHMIIYTNSGNPSEWNLLLGNLIYTSIGGYALATEVLLHLEGNLPLDEETDARLGEQLVKRYLMFRKHMFRVPPRIYENVEGITIKKNDLGGLGDLPGIYRVWTEYKGGIVQSRLTIGEDFRAFFDTDTYGEAGNRQVCLLDISTIHGKQKICMSHHPLKGSNVLGYVIMDIPSRNRLITKGVFCSVGRVGAEHSHSGWMLLQRESSPDDFKVRTFTAEELSAYVKEKEPVLRALDELYRKQLG